MQRYTVDTRPSIDLSINWSIDRSDWIRGADDGACVNCYLTTDNGHA